MTHPGPRRTRSRSTCPAAQGRSSARRRRRRSDDAAGLPLRADPGSIDALRFERLSRRRSSRSARIRSGSGRLREALELWRGAPLADFVYAEFAPSRPGGWRSCGWTRSRRSRRPTWRGGGRRTALLARGGGDPRGSAARAAAGAADHGAVPLRPPPRRAARLPGSSIGCSPTSWGSSRRRAAAAQRTGPAARPVACSRRDHRPGTLSATRTRDCGRSRSEDAGDFFGRDRLVAEIRRAAGAPARGARRTVGVWQVQRAERRLDPGAAGGRPPGIGGVGDHDDGARAAARSSSWSRRCRMRPPGPSARDRPVRGAVHASPTRSRRRRSCACSRAVGAGRA